MADVAISGLTALGAAPATTDLIPLVDVSDTTQALTGTTKKMTVANLFTAPHFTTPVVDSGGLTVTSGNLTVTSGTMTAGSQISTTTGSLEARGAVFSYTDLVGAYAEYVSGTTQARLGAKHPTAAGLVLATVTGGAKVDALTFTAAGAATFAVGLTVSAGGVVVTGGGQFSRVAGADTNVVIDSPTGFASISRYRDAGTDKWLVGKAASGSATNDYEIYNAALGALAFKLTAAASAATFANDVAIGRDLTVPRNLLVSGTTATTAASAEPILSIQRTGTGAQQWSWRIDGSGNAYLRNDTTAFPAIQATVAGGAVAFPTGISVGASTTAGPSLKVPSGTAPTSPSDGDLWYDGTNVKFRVGGTTKTFTLT